MTGELKVLGMYWEIIGCAMDITRPSVWLKGVNLWRDLVLIRWKSHR